MLTVIKITSYDGRKILSQTRDRKRTKLDILKNLESYTRNKVKGVWEHTYICKNLYDNPEIKFPGGIEGLIKTKIARKKFKEFNISYIEESYQRVA